MFCYVLDAINTQRVSVDITFVNSLTSWYDIIDHTPLAQVRHETPQLLHNSGYVGKRYVPTIFAERF